MDSKVCALFLTEFRFGEGYVEKLKFQHRLRADALHLLTILTDNMTEGIKRKHNKNSCRGVGTDSKLSQS